MKKTVIVLLLGLSCIHANSQFKSLINKVKDKVNSKLNGSPAKDTTQARATGDSAATSPAAPAAGPVASRDTSQHVPKPPVFPETGKTVKVTTAVFGVDTTGFRANPGMPGNASMVFAAFLSSYSYIMTDNYIRAEIGKTDSASGQANIAGALANAFAPGITTIIDIKAKKSYTVANYLNILPAAIMEDIASYQDAFGLMASFKHYMQQPDMKITAMGKTVFHGYHANIVDIEMPVTPVTDENGRPSDKLLYLHALLSGNTNDLQTKHYDPSYKLFIETYYSHDLDAMIPAGVALDKGLLHVDGFYVGSILKDEKGNKVVYVLQHIDRDHSMDEGMFQIPDGYEKMTHEQFKQRIREKLRGGK